MTNAPGKNLGPVFAVLLTILLLMQMSAAAPAEEPTRRRDADAYPLRLTKDSEDTCTRLCRRHGIGLSTDLRFSDLLRLVNERLDVQILLTDEQKDAVGTRQLSREEQLRASGYGWHVILLLADTLACDFSIDGRSVRFMNAEAASTETATPQAICRSRAMLAIMHATISAREAATLRHARILHDLRRRLEDVTLDLVGITTVGDLVALINANAPVRIDMTPQCEELSASTLHTLKGQHANAYAAFTHVQTQLGECWCRSIPGCEKPTVTLGVGVNPSRASLAAPVSLGKSRRFKSAFAADGLQALGNHLSGVGLSLVYSRQAWEDARSLSFSAHQGESAFDLLSRAFPPESDFRIAFAGKWIAVIKKEELDVRKER